MKKTTITVVCSFTALLYFFIGTLPSLMWMARTAANNPWFWEPVTASQKIASQLIFCEVMAIAFLPVFVFLLLAFLAWRTHNQEMKAQPIGVL